MSENTAPKVTLGQYKGVAIPRFDRTVTEADVETRLHELQREHVEQQVVEDRPVKMGDIATINYEGFLNGKPFLGGKADNHPLEIGSGSFIPGFEEQIVGHEAGEEFDIEVTFPEQYHSEDLAGKATVFRILLTKIEEKVMPELNDEFAASISECQTLEALKALLKVQETGRREQAARQAAMEHALVKTIENAEIQEYQALVEEVADQMVARFARDLQAQGMNLEQYLSMFQQTEDSLREQVRPQAEQQVKTTLVLLAVADAEKLSVGEAEIEAALEELAAQYQTSKEQMKKAVNLDSLKENLLINQAAALIADSAVEA